MRNWKAVLAICCLFDVCTVLRRRKRTDKKVDGISIACFYVL